MPKITIPLILLVDSILGALLIIFAPLLGLDPNDSWGKLRVTGLVLVLGFFVLSIATLRMSSARKKASNPIFASNKLKIFFLMSHVWLVILAIYVGFITYGNFTTWDHTTHYYTQLADAFTRGNLYVDLKPGNALIQAVEQNKLAELPSFDTEVWDLSLYKGRLYLYWGPVPALVAVPLQIFFKQKITDNYLVFIFSAALVIVNSLIIMKLWRKFFSGVPVSYVIACVFMVGLINPVIWFSSTPYVYSAAILAGQFFLMGGFLFALSIFEKEPQYPALQLFLAGLFWVCSVASRAVNVFSILVLVLVVVIWYAYNIYRLSDWKGILLNLAPLFVPLIVGAVLIGWYNWARFDSPLEFGLRYQVTIDNLNANANFVFHPDYFFLNVYTYLFNPYGFSSRFPFLIPSVVSDVFHKFNILTPHIYYAGQVTGLLFSVPFLLLAFYNLPTRKSVPNADNTFVLPHARLFLFLSLLGSCIAGLMVILFFFFGQTRYLGDIISQFTLIAIMGYWQLKLDSLASKSSRAKLLLFGANLLLVLSLITGLLLSFSGEQNRFQKLNPQLFEKINLVVNQVIK